MKKIISAALSICIALCAAGCGGENVSSAERYKLILQKEERKYLSRGRRLIRRDLTRSSR